LNDIMAKPVACLLCRHERTTEIDSLTPEEIGRLWHYFGVTLSPEAQASSSDPTSMRVLRVRVL
jgi:hypothetical protein